MIEDQLAAFPTELKKKDDKISSLKNEIIRLQNAQSNEITDRDIATDVNTETIPQCTENDCMEDGDQYKLEC